jgi:iron complex transport system ATP-binding protein
MQPGAAPPLLSAERVSAGYRGPPVLQDVTCAVAEGDVMGIIGPNGAGKTTLLRLLGGTLPARSGRVALRGRDLGEWPPRERSRHIAFVPQSLYIPVPFSVAELVAIGRTPHASGWAPLSRRDREVVDRAMELLDVAELRDRPVDELSAGERQRALVALAMAQEPEILLLDEPTAHLDLHHACQFMEVVTSIARERSVAVALSTHDLNLAADFCPRLTLLRGGRVEAAGGRDDVLRADILSHVYGHPIDIHASGDAVWIRPRRSREIVGPEQSR